MSDTLSALITCLITIILTFVLVFGLVFGINTLQEVSDETAWNHGKCNNCGYPWEYEQAVGHRYDTSYIYVCKKCHKRIELYEMRCEESNE